MEGVLVMARGVDLRWHLWSSEGRQVQIRKHLTVASGEVGVLDPPSTWKKLGEVSEFDEPEGANARKEWDCVVAYAMAHRLLSTVLFGEFPLNGGAAAAHAAWWLGEGGTVRVVSADEARDFFAGASGRGGWKQLELPVAT